MSRASVDDVAVQGAVSKSRRILALDIIRGYLLLVILVGHIELPPNFYDFFTGRGRLFVSAAEGFFFLSGMLVGMIYRRRLSLGMKFIFKKMWTRAGELYLASILFTLLYAFIIVKTNHLYIKDGLPSPLNWPSIVERTLSLRFEYGWADFLGRFAILMLFAPFVFYLIAKGRWKLVLIGIIAAWFFRHQNFTLAWQIIFNGGMLIGFYWDELNVKWRSLSKTTRQYIRRSVLALTALSFALSYATVYVLSELNTFYSSLPLGLKNFTLSWDRVNQHIWTYADKWTMGPLRLVLFFVWASVVYAWVAKREEVINSRTKGLLLLIGQNSLFVYIFHSVIVLVFKFFIPAKTNPLQNFLITSLALVVLIFGTFVYKYIRTNWPDVSLGGLYQSIFRKSRELLGPSN